MRNKARCNHLKKIFACCALLFLLFSISVPCFAEGRVIVNVDSYYWGNISDVPTLNEFGYIYRSYYDNPSGAIQGFNDVYDDYYNEEAVSYLVDIVKKQYQIGLYGGSVPVAITVNISQRNSVEFTWKLGVYCVRQSDIATLPVNAGKELADIGIAYSLNGYFYEKNNFRLDYYTIYSNGDVEFTDYMSDGVIGGVTSANAGPVPRLVAILNNDSWSYGDNGYFASYWSDGDGVPPSYTDIMLLYDETERQPLEVINNYQLDIPSIITAVPNGAKQIINNAFGFEIFGINVAGLLSVLLIVAIVGFVVKWLMSR